jgi:hypothetical protein
VLYLPLTSQVMLWICKQRIFYVALLLSGLFVFGTLLSFRLILPYSCSLIGVPHLLSSREIKNGTSLLLEYGSEIETEKGKRGVCIFELRCRDNQRSLDCQNHEPLPHFINCWGDLSGSVSCRFPMSAVVLIVCIGLIFVVSGLVFRRLFQQQNTEPSSPTSQLIE